MEIELLQELMLDRCAVLLTKSTSTQTSTESVYLYDSVSEYGHSDILQWIRLSIPFIVLSQR